MARLHLLELEVVDFPVCKNTPLRIHWINQGVIPMFILRGALHDQRYQGFVTGRLLWPAFTANDAH
jgi:hypothetical protein